MKIERCKNVLISNSPSLESGAVHRNSGTTRHSINCQNRIDNRRITQCISYSSVPPRVHSFFVCAAVGEIVHTHKRTHWTRRRHTLCIVQYIHSPTYLPHAHTELQVAVNTSLGQYTRCGSAKCESSDIKSPHENVQSMPNQ